VRGGALEEAADIEREAQAAVAAVSAARMKAVNFAQIADVRMGRSDVDAPGRQEFNLAYADAAERLARAFDLPMPDAASESEFVGKTRALMADLRSDASSRLHLEARR
jgi:hypothetical protein